MKKLKILFMIAMFGVVISKTFASDFDTNFSFSPISGTNMKLYCETPVYFIISGGNNEFNGFAASIKFDSNNIKLITGTIHSELNKGKEVNEIVGNLYHVGGNTELGLFKTGTVTGVVFSIITRNNIDSTILSLVGSDGTLGGFGLDTTDDGITLNGFKWSAGDILGSVSDTTYNFVALPCVPDGDKPIIASVSVTGGATKIPENQTITFLTYDWNGSNSSKVTHWFNGDSTGNIENYVSAPSNVDNQEGVNSGSISVKVSCSTCSGQQLEVPAELVISNWNGDSSKNALTWDSQRRGYSVSFGAPFPYEVEKKVTVNISVTDNPNENGVTHTKNYSFSFNTPVAPTITRVYPSADTFVSPSKNFAIVFDISDDWAGINTGSVKITIPQIMSGDEILLSSYVYSGSDLDFELIGGLEGLGNSGSYRVSFYPKEDFPVSTEITMNVEGTDLAGTPKVITTKFTTRPSCDYFGCVDNLNIYLGGVSNAFTGKVLVITGTNPDSPYPYLTGENNEILMCGGGWGGITFAGNVPIYDGNGVMIGGNPYINNDLFITGLDFVYENGIITIQ